MYGTRRQETATSRDGKPLGALRSWLRWKAQQVEGVRHKINRDKPSRRTTPAQAKARIDQLAQVIGGQQQPVKRRSILDFDQPAMQTHRINKRKP